MSGTLFAAQPIEDVARLRANPAASWGAIFAGAAVAVSLSLLLMTLGAGLGFTAISIRPDRGVSPGAFRVAGTIWVIVSQWLSAAAGGYIAGRLRHRWLATHTHEVFFRDTAHGLVTWAVATLFVATVLAGSMKGLVGGGAHALEGLYASGALAPADPGSMDPGPASGSSPAYVIGKLFRGGAAAGSNDNSGKDPLGVNERGEVVHIVADAAMTGTVNDEDRGYLTMLVATKTGVSTVEAQKRVDSFIQSDKDTIARAASTADEAREALATTALYGALALLIGAFIASVSAAIGGQIRDEHL